MAVTRRARRSPKGSGAVDELKVLVESLIKENQSLKRQLARLETKAGGTTAIRGLTTIARRLERALESTVAGRPRSGTSRTLRPTATVAKLRKPASPETQAKRLAALAKARQARAAKKAETS
jgi:hypothetical protein